MSLKSTSFEAIKEWIMCPDWTWILQENLFRVYCKKIDFQLNHKQHVFIRLPLKCQTIRFVLDSVKKSLEIREKDILEVHLLVFWMTHGI